MDSNEAYANRINEIRDHHEAKAKEAFVAVITRQIVESATFFESTGLVQINDKDLARTVRDVYSDVFTSFSQYTYGYLSERKADVDPSVRRRMVLILIQFFFANLQVLVQMMTRTTRVDVIAIVQKGIVDGKSNADIAKDIRRAAPKLAQQRATARSQMSVLQASGIGSEAGAVEAGVRVKMWVTTLDERTRRGERGFNHARAHLQTVPINQPFIVSGQSLMNPGDTTLGASIGNVAGCRCVTLYPL